MSLELVGVSAAIMSLELVASCTPDWCCDICRLSVSSYGYEEGLHDPRCHTENVHHILCT